VVDDNIGFGTIQRKVKGIDWYDAKIV